MKFNQTLLFITVYQLFSSARLYAKVLDKKETFPDVNINLLIADQLDYLESSLGRKLSNRLSYIFKKYNMDYDTQYHSLLQLLSFIDIDENAISFTEGTELTDTNPSESPAKAAVKESWGRRLRKAIVSAGKHIKKKGSKHIKKLLRNFVKVVLRDIFINLLPEFEKMNEHSIMALREEFRPSFARFLFHFYSDLFKRFHVKPPKSFSRKHFEEKFGLESNGISLKKFILNEDLPSSIEKKAITTPVA